MILGSTVHLIEDVIFESPIELQYNCTGTAHFAVLQVQYWSMYVLYYSNLPVRRYCKLLYSTVEVRSQ